EARYLSNSDSQASWLRGGTRPVTGFHSTMDRPEPVRRVTPPRITMANTRAQQTSSQPARARSWGKGMLCMGLVLLWIRQPRFSKRGALVHVPVWSSFTLARAVHPVARVLV